MTSKELVDTLNEVAWSLRETGHEDWVVPAKLAIRITGRIHSIRHLDVDSRPLVSLCEAGSIVIAEAKRLYPDLPCWASPSVATLLIKLAG